MGRAVLKSQSVRSVFQPAQVRFGVRSRELFSLSLLALSLPLPAMPGGTLLNALNKSSAKVAEFLVSVYMPKKVKYQFTNKRTGNVVTNYKMECLLLGPSEGSTGGTSDYCPAIVKRQRR